MKNLTLLALVILGFTSYSQISFEKFSTNDSRPTKELIGCESEIAIERISIPTCLPYTLQDKELGVVYKVYPPCFIDMCTCIVSGEKWNCTKDSDSKIEIISITKEAAPALLRELQQKQKDDPENRELYGKQIDQILQLLKNQ